MKYGNISEKDRKGQKKKNIGTKMKFFPPFILQYLQVGIYIGKYINRPFVEFKKNDCLYLIFLICNNICKWFSREIECLIKSEWFVIYTNYYTWVIET